MPDWLLSFTLRLNFHSGPDGRVGNPGKERGNPGREIMNFHFFSFDSFADAQAGRLSRPLKKVVFAAHDKGIKSRVSGL
jgi:hypothetical protein